MGNMLLGCRKVEEKFTRPHGLYHHKDIDHKKLRKLILGYKLAPCYPGEDERGIDLEECPICFLYYPSLNRSRCCMKGICTECFLKMKSPNSALPTQCPFCKTFNYAVEYRGVKTKAEKGLEQIEEQRVIDAKIRIRRKEIQEEEERMRRRKDMSTTSSRIIEPKDVGYISETGEEIFSSQQLGGLAIQHPSGYRQNRDDEFDLENIMLMEAIWLSIQEDSKRHHNYGDVSQLARYAAELRVSAAVAPQAESTSSSSSSGSLAYTLASLAEKQVGVESSTSSGNLSRYNGVFDDFSQVDDHGGRTTGSYPIQDETNLVEVPETFEEQMMVAMAVSLSEARARTRSHEITWR